MKLFIILALAFACGNSQEIKDRTNFVETLHQVSDDYGESMLKAENALNSEVDMHYTMLLNAVLKLGRSYHVTPDQYENTFQSISVEGMAEVLKNPQDLIEKSKALYSSIYKKSLGVIKELMEQNCDVADLPEECDEILEKIIYPLGSPYALAAEILFKMSDLGFQVTSSLDELSHRQYAIVTFLANPLDQITLSLVHIVADIYNLSKGPVERK